MTKKKTFKQVQKKKKKVKTMEPKRNDCDKNNSEKTTFIVVLNTVIQLYMKKKFKKWLKLQSIQENPTI